MNIQSINLVKNISYNSLNFDKKSKPSFRANTLGVVSDTFVRSQKSLVESALSKLRKITLAEYRTLTKEEILALKSEIASIKNFNTGEEILNEDIRVHHYLAESIKQCFDREYGAGNYVVIAIGRSLSSISKLLGMKIGEQNVKNIPMSNLSAYLPQRANDLEDWCTPQEKSAYKKYLASIGLSKDVIENSNKNYIIMDYAFSGKSLENAYRILTSDCFLGNKKRNITSVAAQEVLPLHFSIERTKLLTDLRRSAYKPYSLIDKLDTYLENNINSALDYERFCNSDYQIKTHKLFGFGLLDSVFGDKKITRYDNLEFNFSPRSYIGQHKKVWKNETQQFNDDLFEDRYELEKALFRSKNNPQKQQVIKELLSKIKVGPPPMFYYGNLRPQIIKIINEI